MSSERREALKRGLVIPACPLALDESGQFSSRHQSAVLRYYAAAGAGGVAVGVHTTQFEIRDPDIGLFDPVLELASEVLRDEEQKRGAPLLRIAGVCGSTEQAMAEAGRAVGLEYDAALLSLSAFRGHGEKEIVAHCREIAGILPLVGFYLQPAVGGRLLSERFWREFAGIENVVAIKMAPFNRYQTLDVIRGVVLAGRDDIALYTGNDDNIVADLVTPFPVVRDGQRIVRRIVGGLLGQWSVYTRTFVSLLEEIHRRTYDGQPAPQDLLERNVELTDANAVIFDAANGFRGCIPGINEVLRRRGLLPSSRCLNPEEVLSPGQAEEIDRVERDYPWLSDAAFIDAHREEWLS